MWERLCIWGRALADLILPRTCLVCGRKLGLQEQHLCLFCLADMPRTHFWERSHNAMADKINKCIQHGLEALLDDDSCEEGVSAGDCDRGVDRALPHEKYAYACALFFFQDEGEYRNILYSLKYGGNTSAGEYFGKMLGRKMASSAHFADVDAVVPVPLHWTRKWKRGYNQAEHIAVGIAEAMDTELRTDVLFRRKRTATQTRLDVEQKGKNVMGAFEAVASGNEPAHIVLVDDVFTTGSTLYACYSALKAAYPSSRISFATLGFVGRP